jgi:hypothetical protein
MANGASQLNVKGLIFAGFLTVIGAGSASANVETFTFDAPGNYSGAFTLDVKSGVATSGTGVFHDGNATETMTLLTGGGAQEFNDGTVLSPLTSNLPIDLNGLTFAVGPDTTNFRNDAGLNIWFQNGAYDTALFGHIAGGAENYQYNGVAATVAAVPEPATWTMLILGVGMIGFAARRRSVGAALAA